MLCGCCVGGACVCVCVCLFDVLLALAITASGRAPPGRQGSADYKCGGEMVSLRFFCLFKQFCEISGILKS